MSSTTALPSNKKFGWFFSGITALFCAYFYHEAKEMTAVILGFTSILFALLATVAPNFLEPLNKIWFALGVLLGKIVSPIVLGMIFFFIITPVAVVTRVFGRDELLIKKRQVQSYWIDKEAADPDTFKNQFL
jgi:hypothetical protein